ncbi:hypothetical protein V8E36_007484 [Tilletia maclaganii]
MSIADLYNIKRAIQRDEEWRPQVHMGEENTSLPATATSARCLFCRNALAQYACPTCQAPYCSLACFRSKKHEGCAVAFAKNVVREERELDEEGSKVESSGQQSGSGMEEGGREGMMAILGRRTAGLHLGDLEFNNAARRRISQGAQAEEDEAEEELPVLLELDPRRHADFLAAWRPLLLQRIASLPSAASTSQAPSLGPTASAPRSSPGLLFNIAAVLATHAFITDDLDLRDVQSLHTVETDQDAASDQADPRTFLVPVIRSLFSDLVPFLTASPPADKKTKAGDKVHETVLADAEDVVLWLLSRLQPLTEHADVDANTLLRRMLRSAADKLEERKVVITTSDNTSTDASPEASAATNDQLEDILKLPSSGAASAQTCYRRIHARTRALAALADVFSLYDHHHQDEGTSAALSPSAQYNKKQTLAAAKRTQRKLLFYATVLAFAESEVLEQVVEDLRAAVAGLEREVEVQRARDGLEAWERERAAR